MTDLKSILVVDRWPIFRQGIAQILSAEPGFFVVAQAGNIADALHLVNEKIPDLVLLDANLPGNFYAEAAEKIHQSCPSTAVVVMTESGDKDSLLAAFKLGARGYVLKSANERELSDAVRAVAAGNVHVSPPIAALLMASLTHSPVPDPLGELSSREREILGFIGKGHTNREIGDQIFLSEKTVKHYVTNILQKLQVRSRIEAALFVSRQNLRT